jgi:hypothetical protein
VSDQDIPTSGSRWEPADGAADETTPQPVGTPAEPPTVSAEDAATGHGAVPAVEAAPVRGERLPRRLRTRSAVAAAGVGLVLAGGVGGFVIGHAIADSDGSGSGITTDADPNGFRGPQDGAGPGGRPGDRDGNGQDAPGVAPDRSTPDGSGSSSGDDDGGSA